MSSLTDASWSTLLESEKEKPYFKAILNFIATERHAGKTIYPDKTDLFNAFKLTPYDTVKVVILGQDPYHGSGQAHGLSFSVRPGMPHPPSLKNIFKALENDLGIRPPQQGCLTSWAKQGVLLLNTTLSVEAKKPQSHAKIGWQQFTDVVIKSLNQHPEHIVFLLWGSEAQNKANLIDTRRHTILTASHPSPLSAYRGFMSCRHFSQANEYLGKMGRAPINWELSLTT